MDCLPPRRACSECRWPRQSPRAPPRLEAPRARWGRTGRQARDDTSRSTVFNGGEGCWYDGSTVYFTTQGDNRVWAYAPASSHLEIVYGDNLHPNSPLTGVDNVTVSSAGDLYVAEDGGDLRICVITPSRVVAPLLRLVSHNSSEITGPAFSPDRKRLYFSSQRGTSGSNGGGTTFR